MRINTANTPVVIIPEARTEVAPTYPVGPIEPRPQTPPAAEPPLPVSGTPAPAVQLAQGERRRAARRGEDRRQRQVPVLIDTRVSQRRTTSRRSEDQPAAKIDVEA